MDSSFPVCGKLNDTGTSTSGSSAASGICGACRATRVRLASISVGSTMNRSPATNAVINASRVRLNISPHPDRREGRHQAGQHPEAQQQGHRHIRDQVHLQPSQLLDAERAGGVCRDGEQADRRKPHDEAGRARQRVDGRTQHVEQLLLPLDADERDADDDREQHHGRNDVVRERVERVRRDVEVDEVEAPGGAPPASC